MNGNDEDESKYKVDPNDFKPRKIYGCEIIITSKGKYIYIIITNNYD